MNNSFKPIIMIFHCINAFSDDVITLSSGENPELRSVKLPCSSLVKDVYLLRAYEAGADAVIVLACGEGECRYVDGNLRAKKRVDRVRALLDEIGLGSQRLSLHNVALNDEAAVSQIIQKTVSDLMVIGPNPAARNAVGVLA